QPVRRNYSDVRLQVDEVAGFKVLGIDNGGIDIGEDLELIGTAHIVPVARSAVRDDLDTAVLAHLTGLEWVDHATLAGHAADPLIGLDAHVSGVLDGDSGECPALIAGRGSEPCSRAPGYIPVGARDWSRRICGHDRLPGVRAFAD